MFRRNHRRSLLVRKLRRSTPFLKCLREVENSFGIRDRELQPQRFVIDAFSAPSPHKPEALDLQTAQRLLQRFLKRAADRHRFADAFHLRRQRRIGLREFFEREARDFDHAIIDRRLETGGRFARDVVWNFIQRVADREFGRDLRDRETRSLSTPARSSATRADSSRSRPFGRSRD